MPSALMKTITMTQMMVITWKELIEGSASVLKLINSWSSRLEIVLCNCDPHSQTNLLFLLVFSG